MDEYQTRRSPAGERFIGMFSSPSTPSSSPTEPSYVAGDELHEDDFLFSSSDAAAPQPDGPRSPGRGAPQGHLGLLAALALHEGDKRLLVRGGHGEGVRGRGQRGDTAPAQGDHRGGRRICLGLDGVGERGRVVAHPVPDLFRAGHPGDREAPERRARPHPIVVI
jgi:hypothetical protein